MVILFNDVEVDIHEKLGEVSSVGNKVELLEKLLFALETLD